MKNTIYNVMNANKKISVKVFEKLTEMKGLWCKIKTPISIGSIFGKEDLIEYDEMVVSNRQLLLFGIFGEGSMGGEASYDAFIDGAYALTLYNERLPLQTIVEVNFCGIFMSFKVDDHRNLLPETCQQVFIKNMLVPAT